MIGDDGFPELYGLFPFPRDFRERHEPRAHILAALGVMGFRGDHRMRPRAKTREVAGMEFFRRRAEASRVAADLVESYQARVAIEPRILGALGHPRAAQLLELPANLADAFAVERQFVVLESPE